MLTTPDNLLFFHLLVDEMLSLWILFSHSLTFIFLSKVSVIVQVGRIQTF